MTMSMKPWIAVGVALSMSALANAGEGSRRRILLTHFDPFGGAPANASKRAAEEAAKILAADFDVGVLELPTVYDVAAALVRRKADELANGAELAAVISIGEGGCSIRLETLGRNRDNTPDLADNAGVTRSDPTNSGGRPIYAQGPETIAMPFPVQRAFETIRWSRVEKSLVSLSDDAGAFVCNNTAYHLARHFSRADSKTLFTFIHVPNHRCEKPHRNARLSGSVIARVVRAAL